MDARVAELILRFSRNKHRRLLLMVLLGAALLSMWMSNIAASAMLIAALRPTLEKSRVSTSFRRALLLAVALGANFGGMATPIGSGPNAIAIAALSARGVMVSFLDWMSFAVPLTFLMLALGFAALNILHRVQKPVTLESQIGDRSLDSYQFRVIIIFCGAIVAWLSEPLHGIPAAIIALFVTGLVFALKLLDRGDLRRIDWSTLGLIAGGIALGRLLEQSGVVLRAAELLDWHSIPELARLSAFVFASALLSSLMSNTATVTMLVPIALSIDPSPATPILIALGASFGIPFVISTPPNAIAYGEGGLRTKDLFVLGLPLMIVGCVLVALTGKPMLEWFGAHR